MFGAAESTDRVLGRPVEAWEIPVGHDLVSDLDTGEMLNLPFQPRSWKDVPPDAMEALTELVGVGNASDVLVLPAATRPAGDGWVYVPTQVIGVGVRGVALWVADLPYERVATVVPYRELAMVEHLVGRRYGRLTVLGVHGRLALRYRTRAWPAVRSLFVRIRAAAMLALLPGRDALESSVSWGAVLNSPLVCLDATAPEAAVSTRARHTPWWRRYRDTWPASKAALTAREFVLLGRSAGRLPPARGLDVLAVPRARISELHGHGARLVVVAAGVEYTASLHPSMVDAVLTDLAPRLLPEDGAVPDQPVRTDHVV